MKILIADIVMAAGIALALIMGSLTDFSRRCESLQSEVLRLHIPANSDSEKDQRIKLALRDKVLEEYGVLLSENEDIEGAQRQVRELLPEIEKTCCEFLAQQGVDYSAKAELVNMYFTTRQYEEVTLPAGNYDALRITLGSGEGRNWWCIMFPPLCIPVAAEYDEELLADLTGEERPQVKLALYEFLKWVTEGSQQQAR